MHKYLYTSENENRIVFENFVSLLKIDIPENVTKDLINLFTNLCGGAQSITVEELKKKFKIENHPRVKLMIKNSEAVSNEFDFSILFVSGDKGYLLLDDFLELHRNIYWVTPRENISNYVKMVNQLWA